MMKFCSQLLGLLTAVLVLLTVKIIGAEDTAAETHPPPCPSGYSHVATSATDYDCWKFIPESNYQDALETCGKSGGILIEIFDSMQQSALSFFGAQVNAPKSSSPNLTPLWTGGQVFKTKLKNDHDKVIGVIAKSLFWGSGSSLTVNFLNQQIKNESGNTCMYSQGMFWYLDDCDKKHAAVCLRQKHCPDGALAVSHNGPCFKLLPEKLNYTDAFTKCAQLNYSLAYANNYFENTAIYLTSLRSDTKYYLAFEPYRYPDHTWNYVLALPYRKNNVIQRKFYVKPSPFTAWKKKKAPGAQIPMAKCIGAIYVWEPVFCRAEYRPICRLPDRCPMIYLSHGKAEFIGEHSNGYGTEINITCSPGYRIFGPFRIRCTTYDKNTGRASFLNNFYNPRCLRLRKVTCKAPSSNGVAAVVHDGHTVGKGGSAYVVGRNFTLSCQPGYVSRVAVNGKRVDKLNVMCAHAITKQFDWGIVTFRPQLPKGGMCAKQNT